MLFWEHGWGNVVCGIWFRDLQNDNRKKFVQKVWQGGVRGMRGQTWLMVMWECVCGDDDVHLHLQCPFPNLRHQWPLTTVYGLYTKPWFSFIIGLQLTELLILDTHPWLIWMGLKTFLFTSAQRVRVVILSPIVHFEWFSSG